MKKLGMIFLLLLIPIMESLAQNKSNLEPFLDSLFSSCNNTSSPGIAIHVLKDGKKMASRNYGMAVIEHKVPFTHQSVVRLGYWDSREFIAVALAMMEKDGLLSLDQKVRTYFPKLPAWSEHVSILDLINHSSGFVDEWATLLLMQGSMTNRLDIAQFLDLLYNQKEPEFEPGKGYMYCNSDYGLLRLILEKASGQDLSDFMKKNIFGPLDMKATELNDDLTAIIPGLANQYYGMSSFSRSGAVKTSPAANYRIATTADDLVKWAFACNDKESFVSKAYDRLFKVARQIPVMTEKHFSFGIEFREKNGHTLIQHGGVNKNVYVRRIPSMGLDIITLSNGNHLQSKTEKILDYFLTMEKSSNNFEEMYSKKLMVMDSSLLYQYAGRYWVTNATTYSSHLKHIRYYDIKVNKSTLQFYFSPDEFVELVPIAKDLFKEIDFPNILQFLHPDNKSPMRIEATFQDGSIEKMERKVSLDTIYSADYLLKFSGLYYSKHLDFYVKIVFNEKSELVLKRPTISDKVMEPYADHQFIFYMEDGMSDGWYNLVEFETGKRKEIKGFNVIHPRMMHHKFVKIE